MLALYFLSALLAEVQHVALMQLAGEALARLLELTLKSSSSDSDAACRRVSSLLLLVNATEGLHSRYEPSASLLPSASLAPSPVSTLHSANSNTILLS